MQNFNFIAIKKKNCNSTPTDFYMYCTYNTMIMQHNPSLQSKAVLEPRVSPAFAITYLCNHCNIRFDPLPVKVRKRSWPLMTFEPKAVEVTCVSKSHENTQKGCGNSDPVLQKLDPRSLIPRWPLTPHLLWSHVWLFPRIIVSNSHENTSKYVDTVTLFAKTWTKGHWPLDDLWPHICWGHMCDSTQRSLCPSPMRIHQCMWIQWSNLQITTYIPHTTYYIRYILRREWVIT